MSILLIQQGCTWFDFISDLFSSGHPLTTCFTIIGSSEQIFHWCWSWCTHICQSLDLKSFENSWGDIGEESAAARYRAIDNTLLDGVDTENVGHQVKNPLEQSKGCVNLVAVTEIINSTTLRGFHKCWLLPWDYGCIGRIICAVSERWIGEEGLRQRGGSETGYLSRPGHFEKEREREGSMCEAIVYRCLELYLPLRG